jgi:hypothetical protein
MKLRPVHVGRRYFDERSVTATDPCYSAGTWCTIEDLMVKPGEYECVAWKGREYYAGFDNKRHSYQRVFACGIYLDGKLPDESDAKLVGEIGVDAGLAGFYQDKPDYDDDEWSAFCDKIDAKDYLITDEGFCTRSGYGDGYYPVYSYTDANGDIVALEIKF